MASQSPLHVSFFDLDHTLLSTNSGFRFGKYLFHLNEIPSKTMIRLLFNYFLHLIGFLSVKEIHQRAGELFFFGRRLADFENLVADFLDQHWAEMQNAPGVALFEEAKQQGHYLVILSSAPDFLVAPIAKRYGADEWMSTEYHLSQEGLVVGISSVLTGTGKARLVEKITARLQLPKESSSGYSDSHHDIPFLEAVGTAVAVTPNRRLAAESSKRGWPLVS